jgi:hypothetical protein
LSQGICDESRIAFLPKRRRNCTHQTFMRVAFGRVCGLFCAAALGLSGCVQDARDIHQATRLPEAHPARISARTFPLCSLIGGPKSRAPGVYGTDLGLTVRFPETAGRVSDRLAILFGDTWAKAGDACKYPLAHSDDLEAWLPAHRPEVLRPGPPAGGEAAACSTLEYSLEERGDATSWPKIRLFEHVDARPDAPTIDTGMLRAPNGAFTDGKVVYVMYGADAVPCDSSRQCPEAMLCSADPEYSGKRLGECSGSAQAGNSTPLYCRDGADCPPASKCDKPAHGVCLSTRPFDVQTNSGTIAPKWYADDPRRGMARTRLIAAALFPERPADYAVVVRFATNRFLNVATRTVAYFDPDDPGKNDYRPGHHTLLMWGRNGYAEKGGAQTLPFLLYQPLAEWRNGTRHWHPHFFAGYREDGRPKWSERESDASPIYGTSASLLEATGTHLEWTEPEFDYVNQMSVSYVAPLKRWVMLYGGDDPAFIVLDPATGKAPAAVHLQRSPGAIHYRVAVHPWGRATRDRPASEGFSSPEPALTRQTAAPYLACGEGGSKELPGCLEEGDPNGPLDLLGTLSGLSTKTSGGDFADITARCLGGEAAMAAQHVLSGNPIGRLYGANIIDEWTVDVTREVGEPAAEIYWNVSTWNPYRVALFKTELRVRREPAEPRPQSSGR